MKQKIILVSGQDRLVWPRSELQRATSLSRRTLQNLETRGLLKRVNAGIKIALYSDESVMALFGGQSLAPGEEVS